jgi:hypothetical protein
MPTTVQFRRGTTSQNNSFTGAAGEISVDTDLNVLRVHDNATAGGQALVGTTATQTLTNKTLTSPLLTVQLLLWVQIKSLDWVIRLVRRMLQLKHILIVN